MNLSKIYSTIDTHVAGEPFRIVTQSSMMLSQNDLILNNEILKRKYKKEKAFLLNEPRGHRGMTGCIITSSEMADYGLLFFSHEDVDFKFGGLIASLTALLETGNLPVDQQGNYRIETIHGVYQLKANFMDGEVQEVYLESDESFFIESSHDYDVVHVGPRIYLIYSLPSSIPSMELAHVSEITNWGRATVNKLKENNVEFDGVIMTEQNDKNDYIRSVTFEKDGSIYRSANIDSTVAILTAKRQKSNEIEQLTNESIFGSSITVNYLVHKENRYSTRLKAFITGIHEFVYDEDDPFNDGFILK